MTANRRNINDLRYLTRNNLIIPNNLDIRRNRTVSKSQPRIFSILCIAFMQRNPAISSKVTKSREKDKTNPFIFSSETE